MASIKNVKEVTKLNYRGIEYLVCSANIEDKPEELHCSANGFVTINSEYVVDGKLNCELNMMDMLYEDTIEKAINRRIEAVDFELDTNGMTMEEKLQYMMKKFVA